MATWMTTTKSLRKRKKNDAAVQGSGFDQARGGRSDGCSGVVCLHCDHAAAAHAQAAATQKTVQGRVLEDADKPVVGAIVYLQDGRSNNIRSFVSVEGGNYRFGQLSMDTDYQLWAGFKGRKSPVKNISSFDAKKQLVIDLHLK